MQHDAIIIGGGFAGLAAATYLARARRNVRILDTGKPRNRFQFSGMGRDRVMQSELEFTADYNGPDLDWK